MCSPCFDLATSGLLVRPPENLFSWPFWVIAWFDLSVGYLASMGLARRRASSCLSRFL